MPALRTSTSRPGYFLFEEGLQGARQRILEPAAVAHGRAPEYRDAQLTGRLGLRQFIVGSANAEAVFVRVMEDLAFVVRHLERFRADIVQVRLRLEHHVRSKPVIERQRRTGRGFGR